MNDSVVTSEYSDVSGIYIFIDGNHLCIDGVLLLTGDISIAPLIPKLETLLITPTLLVELLKCE